jgi:hypothetical protein
MEKHPIYITSKVNNLLINSNGAGSSVRTNRTITNKKESGMEAALNSRRNILW